MLGGPVRLHAGLSLPTPTQGLLQLTVTVSQDSWRAEHTVSGLHTAATRAATQKGAPAGPPEPKPSETPDMIPGSNRVYHEAERSWGARNLDFCLLKTTCDIPW